MTMLAVFRSRAQTLEFISVLRKHGVPAQAVNTPKEANVGCGVSARFDGRFLPKVKFCLSEKRYSSFSGIMKQIGYIYSYIGVNI